MYSPLFVLPAWLPAWISPALLILWMPGGFRLTCYYYRKAYYRAFFLDPPACAVGEPRNQYAGETRLLLFQNLHRYFLVPRAGVPCDSGDRRGARVASGRRRAAGTRSASASATLVLAANVTSAGAVHVFAAIRCGTWSAATSIASRACAAGRRATRLWQGITRLNEHHMLWAWTSLFWRDVCRFVRVDGGVGADYRCRDCFVFSDRRTRCHGSKLVAVDVNQHLVMDKYQTFEYDVVVVGAGGAGLRAAIESSALRAQDGAGLQVAAGQGAHGDGRGGVAAALANVDTRDNWQVHFRDTMKGGKFLNQWRMAQLHAQEAPERVRELEEWGAVFDRTKDGRILQRNFGGHTYPRLAHVGDRTGLEMIRTLQDKGVHQGIDVHMECTIRWILKDGNRVSGCFGYSARERPVRRVSGEGGGAGHRRHRPLLGDHVELVGVHGRRACDGAVGRGRPDRHGVRAVSSDRHGLAAERARHADHRRRARRRGRAAQRRAASGSCSTTSRTCYKGEFAETRRRSERVGAGGDRRRAARRRGGRRSC